MWKERKKENNKYSLNYDFRHPLYQHVALSSN